MKKNNSSINIFDYVKENINIVDVIKRDEQLKREASGWRGGHFASHESESGNCLYVNETEQWFYCFHCGAGGSVIDYVMDRDGLGSPLEAAETLCDSYNLPKPDWTEKQKAKACLRKQEEARIGKLMLECFNFYHEQLTSERRQYLYKRGLTDETIESSLIGYAEDGNALTEHMVSTYGSEILKQLSLTGLIFADSKIRDRYQGYYVFPYFYRGKIKFSIGRNAPNANPKKAKYLKHLTPQSYPYVSDVAVSHVLWGEDNVRGKKEVIIAEGVFGALLTKQLGYPVCSPFTNSVSDKDCKKLAKLVSHAECVYIIFDNEKSGAGEKGAKKAARALISEGINVKIATIPRPEHIEKIDLADFIVQSGDRAKSALDNLLSEASTFLNFFVKQIPPDIEKAFLYDKLQPIIKEALDTGYSKAFLYDWLEHTVKDYFKLTLREIDNYRKMITETETGKEETSEKKQGPSAEAIADSFLKERWSIDGIPTLRYYRQDWLTWNGQAYFSIPDKDLRARIANFIINLPDAKLSRTLMLDTETALTGFCLVDGRSSQPLWLEDNLKVKDIGRTMSFTNGWLDFDAYLAGKDVPLEKHTPRLFTTIGLPYDYDGDAQCPKWLDFLNYNLEGDEQRIQLLKEFAGYLLVWDTKFHKFLLLHGDGGTGKSTFTDVITAMLGEDNVSTVPLENFGQRFALSATLGKLANIVSEIGELDSVAEGLLKQFTAGDKMQFERKYRDTFSTYPKARLVLATNTRPRFLDRSQGIWRRLILVPWNVRITEEKRNRHLRDEIKEKELPGVWLWAVAGLVDLLEKGHFTESTVSETATEDYKDECNPARMYLRENVEASPNTEIGVDEIYSEYSEYCEASGFKRLNKSNFGREVKREFPNVKRKQKRDETGSRFYAYTGIGFKE